MVTKFKFMESDKFRSDKEMPYMDQGFGRSGDKTIPRRN